jgi:oligoribonuclease NrnB/cAMP/cGMP phosphodiesterase (DHH superfamily)
MKQFIISLCIVISVATQAQNYSVRLAVLKYGGGGDWYADPTAVPNLARFCNEQLGTNINPDVPYIDVGSPEIFNYPFLHLT